VSPRLSRKKLHVVLVAAALCASVPLAFADPARTRIDMSQGQDAGSLTPAVGPDRPARIPPDPAPMLEKGQWVFDLRYNRGDLFLVGLHRVDLAAPQATPRAMGRFALELFEGPTLIESARFDFPFLGAGESTLDAGYFGAPSFERKLNTRIGVMFPATSRGTRLELWDRATNKRWSLPWPPAEMRAATDAGKEGG
jgi:hypothetical protein